MFPAHNMLCAFDGVPSEPPATMHMTGMLPDECDETTDDRELR
jgi:hypothetical protein